MKVIRETVPKNCVLPHLCHFNCLIDFNPLEENQFKLKTYQQV
mgnify:CR=1 FL=1